MSTSTPRQIRLTFILSIPIRWLHLEWLWRELDRERFDISFILVCFRGRTPHMQDFLARNHIPFERVDCDPNPISLLKAVDQVRRYCRKERTDIVHSHMFLANIVGLLGAYLAQVPVRINTRHFHLHDRARIIVWLDRMANALSTRIITSSRLARDSLVSVDAATARKSALIPFGIDLDHFRKVPPEKVAQLRRKYLPVRSSPVIGVIGRHIESKGIQYVIPAFRKLLEVHPSAFLILAYAQGPYRPKIRQALEEVPPDRYLEVEFEEDIFALYQLFDVCVHVPIGVHLETFGLIYVEALAAGVPTIFTLSGIGQEFLVHRENTWLVEHKNSDAIYQGLLALQESEPLRESLVREGRRSVDEHFRLRKMVRATADLYLSEFRTATPHPIDSSKHSTHEVSP